jgi:hypothetical protein
VGVDGRVGCLNLRGQRMVFLEIIKGFIGSYRVLLDVFEVLLMCFRSDRV